MSLKVKLVSTIAAICMVICLLSVGIWTASTGTVNVGGQVSFVASDVDVTIKATVTGAATANQTKTITWKADSDGKATEENGYTFENGVLSADWTDFKLDFVKGQDIKIVIEITNNSEERSVNVAIVNKQDPEIAGLSHSVDTPADTLEKDGATAGDGISNTGTYTITLSYTAWDTSITASEATLLSYEVKLTNAG